MINTGEVALRSCCGGGVGFSRLALSLCSGKRCLGMTLPALSFVCAHSVRRQAPPREEEGGALIGDGLAAGGALMH